MAADLIPDGPDPDPVRPAGRDRHDGGTSRPVYDYWLGGKDNFRPTGKPPSSHRGRPTIRAYPGQPGVPPPRGAVPGREAGIRQFLDIGTGIPTGGNTHEVAQADRAGDQGRLRRQRPDRARARPGAADQPPEGATAYIERGPA